MKKILIRADGGKKIGMGHIMRMLTLANELKEKFEVIFLCKDNKENQYEAGIERIKNDGFQVQVIDDTKVISEIIKIQNSIEAYMLLTDSYDVDEEYFDTLKLYFNLTGYVDDINKCKMNVDFIINQNINAENLEYSENTNPESKLFLGTKYCMLREEFRKNIRDKEIKEICENILITLGGMDKDSNTLKITKKLKEYNKNIHVVIGNAFDSLLIKELYNLSKEYPNIKIYENANMSKLMGFCDIAISACGSTLYELCAMRLPTLGVVIADNQLEIAKQMIKRKIIIGGVWMCDSAINQINNLLSKLILDYELRKRITERQAKLVNVNGVSALRMEIENLMKN